MFGFLARKVALGTEQGMWAAEFQQIKRAPTPLQKQWAAESLRTISSYINRAQTMSEGEMRAALNAEHTRQAAARRAAFASGSQSEWDHAVATIVEHWCLVGLSGDAERTVQTTFELVEWGRSLGVNPEFR